MIQTARKQLTFEEFLEWKSEGGRYELHNGVVIEMQPTGKHEAIIADLGLMISGEFFD